MDRDVWLVVMAALRRAARRRGESARVRYPDRLIVAMWLWAVAHDRSARWACDRRCYTTLFRPRRLPSVSQFHRRLRSRGVRRLLQALHEALAGPVAATALSYLDGKPLAVGPASKDPDARRGHLIGAVLPGYKLHAYVTEDRRIPLWAVTALDRHEAPVARALLSRVPALGERSLVLADGNYDAHRLHQQVAALGGRLLVQPRGGAGRRHPVNDRKMGPARRALLAAWRATPGLTRAVYRHRIHVEATFSNLCACGGGLGPLPGFVRRLPRVTRWVGGKIILYHAKWRARRANAAAA